MTKLSLSDHRHNLKLNILHESTWGFGVAFHDVSTILPLFLAQLGAPVGIVGSLAGLFAILFAIPQLTSALLGRNIRNIKLATITVHTLVWPPIFIAGFTFAFLAPSGSWAWLFYYICFILYGLAIGFIIPIWANFIRHVTRRENRGTFLGISFMGNSVGGFIGGLIAKRLLSSDLPFPKNFGFGFLITFLAIVIGTILFFGYRVNKPNETQSHRTIRAFLKETFLILKTHLNFRRYLYSRILLIVQLPAVSLYAIHAHNTFHFAISDAGLLTAVKVVAFGFGSFIGGKIGDRFGHKTAVAFSFTCHLLALITALLAQSMIWVYLIFIFLGIASGAFMPSSMSLVYGFAGVKGDSQIYMALIDTILAPFILIAIILSGILSATMGVVVLFKIIGILLIAGLLILLFKVHDPELISN
ncbi:MAG: MFS transporter [Fidelibacterota bacterium]